MSLHDFISTNIAYPYLFRSFNRYGRLSSEYYQKKADYPRLPRTELDRLQLENLRNLLIHASENIPYYAFVMKEAGFDPRGMKDVSELRNLPFLTKDIIRGRRDDMTSTKADRADIYINSSGGSTGTPLNFYQDTFYRANAKAGQFISDSMQGWRFGARTARLWGAPSEISKMRTAFGKTKSWLLNERWYDTFDMSPEKMERYHADLTEFQPDIIIAYAGSAFIYANWLKETGKRPTYPTRAIICSAETLHDTMRQAIEDAFPVRVYNRYGSREVGDMASECDAHEGMHIHMHDFIVECIDPATGLEVRGEPGELVITCLTNYTMPFIRYRIGDMGIITDGTCPCGRQTPKLSKVTGRTSDTITTKAGRMIHGEYFTHLFYGVDGVKQFQFVQEEIDLYRLLIVKDGDGFDEGKIPHMLHEVRAVVGEDSRITVEFPDAIPVEKSGKYRFTISRVPIVLKG